MSDETSLEEIEPTKEIVSDLNPESEPFLPSKVLFESSPRHETTNDENEDKIEEELDPPSPEQESNDENVDSESFVISSPGIEIISTEEAEEAEEATTVDVLSHQVEKVESFDRDESSSAVVPPDDYRHADEDLNQPETDKTTDEDQQESEVPREPTSTLVQHDDPKVEIRPTEEIESSAIDPRQPDDQDQVKVDNEEDSYSISAAEFVAGGQPESKLENHEPSLRRSIDAQEKISFDDFSCETADDLLGNKSLLKKTVVRGHNETRPGRNALATISYELFLVENETDEIHFIEKVSHERFFVSEYDVLPAIDICVQLMDREERALIESDVRHCYGDLGFPEKNIPPVKNNEKTYRMRIDLTLEDWKIPDEISTMNAQERIFWGERKKRLGNVAYQRHEYPIALQCYRFALRFVDVNEAPIETDELSSKSLIDLLIQVENNRAQTFLATEQFESCLNSVDNVLNYQPNNVKALFRRCRALFEMGNYEQAVPYLKKLLEMTSEDVERDKVSDMLKVCQTKLAQYHQNQKEICQRMFQPPLPTPVSSIPLAKTSVEVESRPVHWFPYFVIGGTALAALGLAALIKYR